MDESSDVAAEITPEAFEGEQDTQKAESSPAKVETPDKKPEVVEKESETKAQVADTAAEEAETDSKETDTEEPDKPAEETETKPQTEAETLKPKSENRFQKLANENRALKQQVEQLTAQVYQPETVQDLVSQTNPETGELYTVAEAAQTALDQRMQMRDYNTQIYEGQTFVENQSQQILQQFSWANSDSENFDEELATEAAELVEDKLIRDDNMPEIGPNGQPTGLGTVIGVKGSLEKIYQTLDRAAKNSEARGQLKGQQATEQMLANADTASSSAPPKKKADPLETLWAEPL